MSFHRVLRVPAGKARATLLNPVHLDLSGDVGSAGLCSVGLRRGCLLPALVRGLQLTSVGRGRMKGQSLQMGGDS